VWCCRPDTPRIDVPGSMREHGTKARYTVDKCRCEPCREANSTYERRRRANIRHTRRDGKYVDLPTIGESDVTWMHDGACRADDIPTWWFFPGRGDSTTRHRAVAVCDTCPVREACADYAHTWGLLGIWGGLSRSGRYGRYVA